MHILGRANCKFHLLLATETEKIMPRNRISDQRKAACVQKYIQTESIVATQRWYRTTYGGLLPEKLQSKDGTANFRKTGQWQIFLDREGRESATKMSEELSSHSMITLVCLLEMLSVLYIFQDRPSKMY